MTVRKMLSWLAKFLLFIIWLPFGAAGLVGLIVAGIFIIIPIVIFIKYEPQGKALGFFLAVFGWPFIVVGMLGFIIGMIFIFIPFVLVSEKEDYWYW